MGAPFPIIESYLGFMRDLPRHQLPGGILWDMVDWIPELDGAARRRFGWAAISTSDFATLHATTPDVGYGVGYAPFSQASGSEVVAFTSGGQLFKYKPDGTSAAYVGSVGTVGGRPFFHREKLIIMGQGAAPSYYAGNGAAPVAITGPHGKCGTIYGDYSVLANTYQADGNAQRAYFSAAGDPTSWDTTNSWVDIPGAIVGCQGIRNALVFFTAGQMWRIRGDTPPQANVVGNLVRDHLYDTGLLDERSIATYGEQILFANSEGVWMTDGAQVKNYAEIGGIATYWRSLLAPYTSSWTIAGGIYKGYYMVSIIDGSNNLVDFLVCDISQVRRFRFSDIRATMFARGTGGSEKLFFVSANNGLVGDMSPVWSTQSAADQGGTAILPSLETPLMRGWQRYHRKWIPTDATSVWQRLYVNVEAPGTGSALEVAYTIDPEAGGVYTTMGNIPAASGLQRQRIGVNPNGGGVAARGIAFRLRQTAAMSPTDLRLNDLELEYYTREGSR